jgi:hypothetical protein
MTFVVPRTSKISSLILKSNQHCHGPILDFTPLFLSWELVNLKVCIVLETWELIGFFTFDIIL